MLRSLAPILALISLAACGSTTEHPPQTAAAGDRKVAPQEPVVIVDDYDAAVERARKDGVPLLVSFTSHTCQNCRMMEVVVFDRPEIRTLRAGYVEARLHLDAQDDAARASAAQKVEAIAGTSAVPMYVVLDSASGEEISRFAGASLNEPERFAAFLEGAGDSL